MAEPRVSVLMAVYNGEPYLAQALTSILSQEFEDLELILVDDGSTDGTPQIVAGMGDARIVYTKNLRNIGQTASLARAVTIARAGLLARLDADDLFLPGKLGPHVAYMESHPQVAVCGTAAVKIDERDRHLGRFVPPLDPRAIRFKLLRAVPFCHVSVLMRRQAVLAAGNYDPHYRYAADFALWSALAARGATLANLPEVSVAYREYATSTGAAAKLARAGEESAAIIVNNWRTLTGIELDAATARTLDLLLVPEAPIAGADRVRAARTVLDVGARKLGPVPRLAKREVMQELAWGLAKGWSRLSDEQGKRRVRAEMSDAWAAARGWRRARPWIAAAIAASFLGPGRADRMRRIVQTVRGVTRKWLA